MQGFRGSKNLSFTIEIKSLRQVRLKTVTTSFVPSTSTIQVPPNYALPAVLSITAIGLAVSSAWVGSAFFLVIASLQSIFGLFLMIQAATLRLRFTQTALEIYRVYGGETLIRSFPYQDWQNWQIFWSSVPILFYFKEVKSIHFLPILFDAKTLQSCLEQRCPRIEVGS